MQTEHEFLKKLNEKLKMLPDDDRNDIIDSYRQQFSEMRAEGMDDEQIINNLESIDVIAENIKKEFNISRKSEFQAKLRQQYHNAKTSSKAIESSKKSLVKTCKVICHVAVLVAIIIFALAFIATLFTMPLAIYVWGVTVHAIGFYVSLLCLELITLLISIRIISRIEKFFTGGINA